MHCLCLLTIVFQTNCSCRQYSVTLTHLVGVYILYISPWNIQPYSMQATFLLGTIILCVSTKTMLCVCRQLGGGGAIWLSGGQISTLISGLDFTWMWNPCVGEWNLPEGVNGEVTWSWKVHCVPRVSNTLCVCMLHIHRMGLDPSQHKLKWAFRREVEISIMNYQGNRSNVLFL